MHNLVSLPSMLFEGLKIRTNNKNEFDPTTALIGKTIGDYMSQNIPSKILNKASSGITYALYSNYESDMNGDYDYLIGEQVLAFGADQLAKLEVPAQKYVKFTSENGPMPKVCIDLWMQIWQDTTLNRSYVADFELYDHRAADAMNTVMEIYIGVK